MENNLSVEQALQQRKQSLKDNIAHVVEPTLVKGGLADGEKRQWGGKDYIKQAGKWVLASEKKDSKGQPTKSGESKDKAADTSVDIDSHEVAQLTHMKSIIESNSDKAYEIFLQLSPEAQAKVPQEIVNKMVQHSHDDPDDDKVDYDTLGDDKSKKNKNDDKTANTKKDSTSGGKHYKDMDVNELREVAKVMKIKVDEKMPLSKLRTTIGDHIIDMNIKQQLAAFKTKKSNGK